ncbi:marine proteobacterial sortase target protein [Kiloniella laminariae]|uniref:marine proteobacterial sortase target protein n=1 Tax=Kiloniella laminariae TaxID=454162 RepID=UPI00037638FA|nr:marine proteobacterial sortase target protein [Kiloniella laminariae]
MGISRCKTSLLFVSRSLSDRFCRRNSRRWLSALALASSFAFPSVGWANSPLPNVAPSNGTAVVKAGESTRGSLLLQGTEPGLMVEAPQLATSVEIDINGPIARTKVTQRFRNPTNGWVEGKYVFPLPEQAAVDSLKMQIGTRFIEGQIKPREEARQIYEEAKREGKKTALVEQQRPNLFTNAVANIGPGEIIVVQIEYQETVKQSDGQFSLRYPMVVAPRYNPKPRLVETVSFNNDPNNGDKSQWGSVETADEAANDQNSTTGKDPVPDRDTITAPVLDPRVSAPSNPVYLSVHLAAGFPLGEIRSPFHAVTIDHDSPDDTRIKLSEDVVPADRDFELTWQADKGASPRAALFSQNTDKGDFLLAFITPPKLVDLQAKDFANPAREIIFVIDNSGSMAGPSMVQAKDSLLFALDRLAPQDRFNVVRFDDTYDVLFNGAVDASATNLDQARRFVSGLEANGGTEMLPALKAALQDGDVSNSDILRQVVFLTDGAIGNEQEMFDTIVKQRGRSRIFTVGIGSAPNSHFMARASEMGKGSFTHIGSEQQVRERMAALFTKLENPVMTDLALTWEGKKASSATYELSPATLPDLYSGEPLVIAARRKVPPSDEISGNNSPADTPSGQPDVGQPEDFMVLSGRFNDQPWSVRLPLAQATVSSGIDKLWARKKIADYEGQMFLGNNPAELDQLITTTAMDFHLISRLTSLVAVDVTPSRPQDAELGSTEVPLNLPAGWDFDKVFGPLEKGTPDQGTRPLPQQPGQAEQRGFENDQAALSLIATSPTRVTSQSSGKKSIPLPATATDAETRMLIGLLLLMFSLLFWLIRQRLDHAPISHVVNGHRLNVRDQNNRARDNREGESS